MRKMLTTKAGATFHKESPNLTFAVRKEDLEIIYKVKPGVYMILTLCRTGKGKGTLFANWGTYLNRMTNPKAQMPQLKRCCPTLYGIMVNEDKEGVMELEWGKTEEMLDHGFGLEIPIPEKALIFCLDDNVRQHVTTMINKMLKIYNELVGNPPFPAWKTGLDEIWE